METFAHLVPNSLLFVLLSNFSPFFVHGSVSHDDSSVGKGFDEAFVVIRSCFNMWMDRLLPFILFFASLFTGYCTVGVGDEKGVRKRVRIGKIGLWHGGGGGRVWGRTLQV